MKISITFHIDHKNDEIRMREVLRGLKMPNIKVIKAATGELHTASTTRHPEEIAMFPHSKKGNAVKRITKDERKMIIKMLKEGKSVDEVSKHVGCSMPTVYIIKTKARREGHVFPESRGWRKTNGEHFRDREDGPSPDVIEQALEED